MLVVTRRRNEKIVIGDAVINIYVLDIKGEQVRIGIDAPKPIPVHRGEVYLKLKESKKLSITKEPR